MRAEPRRRLLPGDLEACTADFDGAVEREPGIDRFCSRSEWILPFHRAFLPERELRLYREGDSFATFAAREHESVGRYLEPIDTMWCFACPLLGPQAVDLLAEAVAELGPGAPFVLAGIPATHERAGLLGRTVLAFDGRYTLRAVDTTLRWVASLEGGLDGWLSRRAPAFRRNLRSAVRKAEEDGVRFEHLRPRNEAELESAYARVLDVEERSWKAAEGSGVAQGPMRSFYDDMLPRLVRRGALRVVVATREGRDVGYAHGAVTGDHFRGLQLSADRDLAHLSLGNLLQRALIEGLCEEGIRSYDLGTRSDYKRRWAEEGLRTVTIVARPV